MYVFSYKTVSWSNSVIGNDKLILYRVIPEEGEDAEEDVAVEEDEDDYEVVGQAVEISDRDTAVSRHRGPRSSSGGSVWVPV